MFRIAVTGEKEEKIEEIHTVLERCSERLQIRYQVQEYSMPMELLWEVEENNYYDVYIIHTELSRTNMLKFTECIRKKCEKAYIIWVSSSMEYCIQGYEYEIYRYLMEDEVEEKLPQILLEIAEKISKIQQYVIEEYSKIIKIEYSDILYFYVDGKYTYFKTTHGIYRDRKSLKWVYEELKNHTEELAYVDKGCVVNMQHILKLEDKKLTMDNGEVIPVSIPQNKKIKNLIRDFWKDNNL